MWVWVGIKTGFLRDYNLKRDKSLRRAKESLERAFTPQLKSMLEKHYKDLEDGK